MPDGQVLEFTRVTKRFNDVTAVSDFSARIEPGVVTAFLGPNGAGKTTTLRILLGQVRATSGTATIGGVAFSELRNPLRTIGSVLEETVYRPRRSAARQLTIAAKANGIPLSRVDEVLALVGLEHEAEGRIGSFSLGMRQRLSVAHALLGDPGALVFDEPANGLDPEGIRWMRLLMRRLADEGRTVLVSSHVLSEVEQVADNVLVLSKGHLMLSSGIETLADPASGSVVVDALDRAALTAALSASGFDVEVLRSGLTVRGGDAGTVGRIAADAGIALSTLVQRGPTLEDVFIDLVRGGTFEPRASIAATEDVAPVTEEADAAAAEEAEAAVAADTGADAGADAEADDAGAAEDVPADGPATDAGASEDADEAGPEVSSEPGEDAGEKRSFDDILFGDVSGNAAAESGSVEAGDDAEGVEVFTDLQESEPASDDAVDAAESPAAEDDPRSAAVSAMLADAARAYYEDEPREYPVQDAAEEPGSADAGDEQAHWSVASTGVIDVVPQTATDEDAGESAQSEDGGESTQSEAAGESAQSEAAGEHDGHRPEGEHHEHHEGEHHEHHEGEHHEHHHG